MDNGRMPALYVPHGAGPCFFMDWNPPDTWRRMGDWLRNSMTSLVSDRFDAWLTAAVAIAAPADRAARLSTWAAHPDGRAAHPREEHLLPLMVVAGSGGATAGRRVFSDRVMETTVSAFRFD